MKTEVQRICKEKWGFTPVKGDIRIGPEKSTESGVRYREVRVGNRTLNISFSVTAAEVSDVA